MSPHLKSNIQLCISNTRIQVAPILNTRKVKEKIIKKLIQDNEIIKYNLYLCLFAQMQMKQNQFPNVKK